MLRGQKSPNLIIFRISFRVRNNNNRNKFNNNNYSYKMK